jgi:16S rRNA processing protein RimM
MRTIMEYLKLGQIVSVVGIKGELKVYPYTDYSNNFEDIKEIIIDNMVYKIEKVRRKSDNIVILKLEGIDDRNTSETYRSKYIFIDKKDAKPLEDGAHYIYDLIGLLAETENGEKLGRLINVIQNKSQDIYEFESVSGDTFLIPAVDEFIVKIDTNDKKIILRLIEGLI